MPEPRLQQPILNARAFYCPHCDAYAHQNWKYAREEDGDGNNVLRLVGFRVSICQACTKKAFWYEQRMIQPELLDAAPKPSPDMPDDVRLDYEEARAVYSRSARAAGGLLRIGFEKLFPHLGVTNKSPNDAIAELVKKGLVLGPLQQAMDSLRVFANQTAHDGFVKLEDQPETVQALFMLMNYIVEQMITRPKEIAAIYAKLPSAKVQAIEQRDGKKV